ncbi:FkbM family methyltransferase [Lachnospiraceae bacterium 29-84]
MKLDEVFTEIEKGKEYWVYGLGTSGRLFIDLCIKKNYTLAGVVVGDGYKTEEKYRGLKIYEMSELEDYEKENLKLFYTVKNRDDNILKLLNGINVVDISSVQLYKEMLENFYTSFFRVKEVENQIKSQRVLNFRGCLLLNPKLILKERGSSSEQNCFLEEIGDLLLPSIWGEYGRIDEGAYEYGGVTIENSDVMIDCGANIGLYSSVAAWKGATVYAFEPEEEMFEYLKLQAQCYPENIFPVKKALSNYSGLGEIYIDEDGNMAKSSLHKEEFLRKEVINCITIDEFVYENNIEKVDFIKADIEGEERNMLLGARNVLAKFAPKLAICTYHREDDKEVLSHIILEANPDYKIVHKWKKLYAYVE